AYAYVLLGPACLPLRPTGAPPDPPAVARASRRLDVRGPAEVEYRLENVPPAARLRLEVEPEGEPVRVVLLLGDGAARREVAAARVSRGLLDWNATKELDFDLSPWSGQGIDLRIGIYPERCRSAFATARIHAAEVFSGRRDGTAVERADAPSQPTP
ncbi:MAG: hypothetical protein ACREQ9_16095, partial [Candidatus Binatia bacterium]